MSKYTPPCSPSRSHEYVVPTGTGFCKKPVTNKPPERLTAAETALLMKVLQEMQQRAAEMKDDYARQVERAELREAEAEASEAAAARKVALANRLRLFKIRMDAAAQSYALALKQLKGG